jgi:hypothetical protein
MVVLFSLLAKNMRAFVYYSRHLVGRQQQQKKIQVKKYVNSAFY